MKSQKLLHSQLIRQLADNLQLSSGQTMIEVIVGLMLIILFLSGVVVVELFAIRNINYAQNKSIATRLASQQLERARVVRDSARISELNSCEFGCYINPYLTPIQTALAPTGIYTQNLTIKSSSDCPKPTIAVTPEPVFYKATAVVSWAQNATITPAPEVQLSTCITDWR